MVKSLFGELCKRDLDSGQIVEDMDALLKNVLYKCQRVKTYMRESLSQKSSLKITPEPWVSFQWWQWWNYKFYVLNWRPKQQKDSFDLGSGKSTFHRVEL